MVVAVGIGHGSGCGRGIVVMALGVAQDVVLVGNGAGGCLDGGSDHARGLSGGNVGGDATEDNGGST